MRRWIRKEYTEQQKFRRESIEPRLLTTHGCITMDDYAEDVLATLQSNAIDFGTLWESGQMPVLKYDQAFLAWRDEQIRENAKLVEERITCTLPWQVLNHLDASRKESDRLYWSQSSLGSCMGHADAFAHHSSTLYWIARGAPLKYCPINPVVTWAITKGGSLRGGQTVSEMSKGANEIGHFIERLVGTNNLAMPSNYKQYLDEALKYQSAIMFLDFRGDSLCDEIFACCAAGLSVAVGNSNAVSGSSIDKNGIKVATVSGNWAHACLTFDQKVYTTDGITTARDLINKNFLTLSYSKRLGRMAVKKARAWYSGVKKCVRISTNVGTFVVTHDHPFMLRNGKYVKAEELTKGDRLFHANTSMDEKGYVRVSLRDGRNSKKRLHHLIGIDILGAIPGDQLIIHHKDHNILNNRLDNLEVTTRGIHSAQHRSTQVFSDESQRKKSASMKKVVAHGGGRYSNSGTWYSPPWNGKDSAVYSNRFKEGKHRIKFVKVLDVIPSIELPIVSVEVIDPEPDDKRIFGEHNYMLCPMETEQKYSSIGIVSGNTSFTGHRKVNGTEYIGWVNSHGARYKSSDEGEPADMCWMDKKAANKFCATMHQYGPPYIVFPESVTIPDRTFYVKQQIPWPSKWRF